MYNYNQMVINPSQPADAITSKGGRRRRRRTRRRKSSKNSRTKRRYN
jgi:hypothetical protein